MVMNTQATVGGIVTVGKGKITIDATIHVGATYFLSETAGKMCLYADAIGANDFQTVIGVVTGAHEINVVPQAWGVAYA